MASIVRKYFTQDLTDNEKKSYIEYINGNDQSTDWIEKALIRREPLLLMELQCDKQTNHGLCNQYVSIRETGICKCSKGHNCYDMVLTAIYNLN